MSNPGLWVNGFPVSSSASRSPSEGVLNALVQDGGPCYIVLDDANRLAQNDVLAPLLRLRELSGGCNVGVILISSVAWEAFPQESLAEKPPLPVLFRGYDEANILEAPAPPALSLDSSPPSCRCLPNQRAPMATGSRRVCSWGAAPFILFSPSRRASRAHQILLRACDLKAEDRDLYKVFLRSCIPPFMRCTKNLRNLHRVASQLFKTYTGFVSQGVVPPLPLPVVRFSPNPPAVAGIAAREEAQKLHKLLKPHIQSALESFQAGAGILALPKA